MSLLPGVQACGREGLERLKDGGPMTLSEAPQGLRIFRVSAT